MHFLAPAWLLLLIAVVAVAAVYAMLAASPQEVRRAIQQCGVARVAWRRAARAGAGI